MEGSLDLAGAMNPVTLQYSGVAAVVPSADAVGTTVAAETVAPPVDSANALAATFVPTSAAHRETASGIVIVAAVAMAPFTPQTPTAIDTSKHREMLRKEEGRKLI
jgi:hypothetical protein